MGKRLPVIMDCGAQISIMSNEARKEFNFPICDTEAKMVAGCYGTLSIPIGEVEAELTVGRTTRKIRFIVVEKATNTLLGLDAMREFGVTIDSASGSLFVRGEKIRGEGVHTPSTTSIVSFTDCMADETNAIHDILFVYQEWPVENRVRSHFVGSTGALVIPFGKSTFIALGEWKKVPLPYRLHGPCQVYNNVGTCGLIAS